MEEEPRQQRHIDENNDYADTSVERDAQPPDVPGGHGLQPINQRASHWAGKNTLLIEVVVVLLLATLPDLYNALQMLGSDRAMEGNSPGTFVTMAIGIIVRSMQISAPIPYIVWRTGDGFASVGLVGFRWLRDLGVGIGAYIVDATVYFLAAYLLYYLLYFLGDQSVFDISAQNSEAPTLSLLGFLMIVAMSVFNAFAEELAMRGYLLTRLERLFGSTVWAIIASTAVFASYHVYQGVYGIIGATAFGLVAGGVFVWTRSLWTVFVMHLVGDLVPHIAWMLGEQP
jgi:membrane protease YdiL (CAAX protease family)